MMFFPEGNKEKGLEQLKEAAKVGKYSSTRQDTFW